MRIRKVRFSAMNPSASFQHLLSLPPGRYYGHAEDQECWTMVGRNLRDVEEWAIVPPAASISLAWGEGGCELSFEGGQFHVGPGDWMWIDAGFAHKGRNIPGSDFLTVFFSDKSIEQACLHLAPIGAASQPAPREFAAMLVTLVSFMLRRKGNQSFELPARNAILDRVGTVFQPRVSTASNDDPMQRCVERMTVDPLGDWSIADIAAEAGMTDYVFSRRFSKRYCMTPISYRKQLRLAAGTRMLLTGYTVSRAAHEARFADTAHFSRTFKEQYGISPGNWVNLMNAR